MVLLALALALQAETPAPATYPFEHVDFDLALYGIAHFESGIGVRCRRSSDPSVITVCATRGGGAYPLEQMDRLYGRERIDAEIRIAGDLHGGVHVEQVNLDPAGTDSSMNHNVSNRIMVGIRLPF